MKLLLLLVAACLFVACAHAQDGGGVLLSSVGALTLRSSALTTARRTAPQPQLVCSGAECAHAPTTVRCTNAGLDTHGAVQWTCEAELAESLSFGRTHVSCEGYSRAGDPYVLPGSCSLEYDLVRAPVWRTPVEQSVNGRGGPYKPVYATAEPLYVENVRVFNGAPPSRGEQALGIIVTLFAVVCVLALLYACIAAPPTHVHMPPQPSYVGAPVYAQPVYVAPSYGWGSGWGWSGNSYSQGVRDGAAAARPTVVVHERQERQRSPERTRVAKGYASSSSR